MTLTTVFAAIAGLSVTTASVSPTVYTYSALPQFNDTADLPARLLMPQQDRGSQAADFEHVALGTTVRATRRIVDLLLMAKIASGQGMAEHYNKLVGYADAYEAVVKNDRSLGVATFNCTNLAINMGRFTYSEVDYFGVEVVLTVDDYL